MRVIAGKARRLALKTLDGKATRPTTDRIKETLFNMLSPELPGCMFLDLFAGTGQIGIEALSRGAKRAVFVDNSRQAAMVIKDNLTHTHLSDQSQVLMTDALGAIRRLEGGEAFDVIFIDPPYHQDLERIVLEKLASSPLVHDDTLIVVEAAMDTDFDYLDDLGLEVEKRKEYKTNVHMFLRRRV